VLTEDNTKLVSVLRKREEELKKLKAELASTKELFSNFHTPQNKNVPNNTPVNREINKLLNKSKNATPSQIVTIELKSDGPEHNTTPVDELRNFFSNYVRNFII